MARENAEGTTPPGALVNGMREDLTGEFRRPFFLLQCAVGIMLLIAGANVANLLLARYSARGYEFSVRIAIGASRAQLVRQLLAEKPRLHSSRSALVSSQVRRVAFARCTSAH